MSLSVTGPGLVVFYQVFQPAERLRFHIEIRSQIFLWYTLYQIGVAFHKMNKALAGIESYALILPLLLLQHEMSRHLTTKPFDPAIPLIDLFQVIPGKRQQDRRLQGLDNIVGWLA